jgi:hypothetical protein
MKRVARWATAAVVVLVPLGIILPAIGEGGSPDVNNAKQMVSLIEQGQLNLADATKIAEKHIKGTALAVNAGIQQGERNPQNPAEREKPGGPGAGAGEEKSYSMRVVYDITCFANDKVEMVQVDALTKKVIEKEGEEKKEGEKKEQENTPPQP